MLKILAILVITALTFFGIKYRWNKWLCSVFVLLLTIGAIYHIKFYEFDPILQEENVYLHQLNDNKNHEMSDEELSAPVLSFPFMLPMMLLFLILDLMTLASLVALSAFAMGILFLGISGILGLLFQSYKVAVLSILTLSCFVGTFILTILLVYRLFPYCSYLVLFWIGIVAGILSMPVPIVTHFFILWYKKPKS